MKTIKETLEFEFYQESEAGTTFAPIKVYVAIDYKNNKISLVEPCIHGTNDFEKKEYVFNNRGVEFMNGWLNILESMQSAIREAKKKVEEYQKREQDKKNDDVTEILLQATELVKGKKKNEKRTKF